MFLGNIWYDNLITFLLLFYLLLCLLLYLFHLCDRVLLFNPGKRNFFGICHDSFIARITHKLVVPLYFPPKTALRQLLAVVGAGLSTALLGDYVLRWLRLR